jgi:signal transduction histidine kinase/ligand-binding sensor domain-containing protein/DNA-binding response OmpR family regulator
MIERLQRLPMSVLRNLKRFKPLNLPVAFLLFIQALAYNSYSQSPTQFFVQQLDNRNGLSNSSINNIFKDVDSLLWIATWDGLNMYDGTSFHVYNYSKENSYKSIGSNVIQRVVEDSLNNIWISTMEGVSRYDKKSGKFQNYFYDRSQQSSISEQEYDLTVDTHGSVFCLSVAHGLMYFDAKADSFRICMIPPSQYKIIQLVFDDSNRLWLLNDQGDLQVFGGNHSGFNLLKSFRGNGQILRLFHVNGRIFFTSSDNVLFESDPITLGQTRVMKMDCGLTAMILYQNHFVLAWATKGYCAFDLQFQTSDFLKTEARQMENIRLTSLARGSEQILWLGTDGNGMIKIYPRTKSFETVSTSENGSPYNKPVRSFCQENGNLWVGTKGNGIIRIKDFWSKSDVVKRRETFLAPQLDNNAVYSLKRGMDDFIYIGTDGKGIGVYDLKGKKFYKWSSIRNHNLYSEFGSVYAISQDTDRSLWLGTSGYGLIHLKIDRNSSGGLSVGLFEKYNANNVRGGPANDIIYALADDKNNKLWIGCRYGGLSLLDKKTRSFKTFKAFTYEGSISNNDVLSLYKDSRERLWVGTSYGLNWISGSASSSAEPVFKKLTTSDGLPNNTIHGIMEDAFGNIWASTNRGLVQADPETGKISNYQQVDGLQSNEFCDGAVWKDSFSQLFFGGTSGINFFLPQHIKRSGEIPNLLASGIMMSGKTANENSFAVMKPHISRPMDFTIERKDDFFELEIKALSFLNAEKCEYAWFMEGYDNIWHSPGTSGKITYSNILPGSYLLKVKWSNGEGAWTPDTALLVITVKQYFWLTPYAFTVYILLFCGIVLMIYRYSRNKRKIKQQLILEHAMRTREEELHQDRIGFFTNIAHELQTPLTLIMGSSEVLVDKTPTAKGWQEKSHFISLIHQQASKLTYLVHQLMEFRKGESGFFNNRYVNLNISEMLQNLADPFIALSKRNGLKYETHITAGITGWMDKDKLEKIIFNLLSNAFKHTDDNEKIVLSVNEDNRQSLLNISVSNSGCDLPPGQLNKLFEKFYVAGENKPGTDKMGTGIGLAFTRQLVLLLNGHIEASILNGWIFFNVQLPLFDLAGGQKPPEKKFLISGNPSYLFKSITTHYSSVSSQSTVEKNKEAIIETLQAASRKNILIIEDEPEIRFLLRNILRDDYIISEAEDGEKAIGFLQKVTPDLIICDVMMPNLSGLELCNKVKNTPATCHIPFIILSARDSLEQHMEGYEVGADAYIAKPFHTPHLKIRVRKMLEQAEKLHQFFKNEQPGNSLVEADLPPTDKQFLEKLVVIIEEKMDDTELNAEQIEKILCLSKMQLYRKLKTLTGMTPGEFIKHIRIKHAAYLLTTTQMTVSEIFLRTGFNNQSYFFREFRKRYQAAPNEYRASQIIHM